MNEATAALLGSIVTAVVGLLGIIVTQWVALRTARIRAKQESKDTAVKNVQPELPFEGVPGTGITGFALLRLDIEELKVLLMEVHKELKKF